MTEVLQRILTLPKFGTGIGLHRMMWLQEQVQAMHPGLQFEAIKITGSNGKGTTASMLRALFDAAGETVGLFTSPHLYHVCERIQIGTQSISEAQLSDAMTWFERMTDAYAATWPHDRIGAFEALTAMALWSFAQQGVNHLVLEAGIGGRYDATRVVAGRLAALVSLDLEHTQLLGKDLESIAYDKSDICPSGGTLIVGRIPMDVLRKLKAYCRLRSVEVVSVTESCEVTTVRTHGTTRVSGTIDGIAIDGMSIKMPGAHQVDNACVAALLGIRWFRDHRAKRTDAEMAALLKTCFSDVQVPGRGERIFQDPDVYVDVGHTPEALRHFAQTVEKEIGPRPVVLVTGVSDNKDIAKNVSALLPIATEVICTRAHHHGASVTEILRAAQREPSDLAMHTASTVEDAVSQALARARLLNGVVVVAGSLFLAVEAKLVLEGADPTQHVFF